MRNFVGKLCCAVTLLASLCLVTDIHAGLCSSSHLPSPHSDEPRAAGVRSQLAHLDVAFVGRIVSLDEATVASAIEAMRRAEVLVEKRYKGDLGGYVTLYVHEGTAAGVSTLFFAHRETLELIAQRRQTNKFNRNPDARTTSPLLRVAHGCTSWYHPATSKLGTTYIRALDRLVRSRSANELHVHVGVHNFASWSEPSFRASNWSHQPDAIKTKITLTGNGKTFALDSDEDGGVVFNNLANGRYKITVPSVPDYRLWCSGVGVKGCDAIEVTGGAVKLLNVWYEPVHKVKIKLTSPAFDQPLATLPLLANFRLRSLAVSKSTGARPPPFHRPSTVHFFTGATRLRADMLQNQIALPPGEYVLEMMLHEAESGRRLQVLDVFEPSAQNQAKPIATIPRIIHVGEGDQLVEIVLPDALTPVKIAVKYEASRLHSNEALQNQISEYRAVLFSAEMFESKAYGYFVDHEVDMNAKFGSEFFYGIPGQIHLLSSSSDAPVHERYVIVYVERDTEVVLKTKDIEK